MGKRKTFTLRVDENTLNKLHYISDKNKRSVNNQIDILIDSFISEFVKENGKIPLDCEEWYFYSFLFLGL